MGDSLSHHDDLLNFVNPQGIRIESEYVWTGEFDMNTMWSHNVWTRIFSYPERKSCGFKNIRIRVDGAVVDETGYALQVHLIMCNCIPIGGPLNSRWIYVWLMCKWKCNYNINWCGPLCILLKEVSSVTSPLKLIVTHFQFKE